MILAHILPAIVPFFVKVGFAVNHVLHLGRGFGL